MTNAPKKEDVIFTDSSYYVEASLRYVGRSIPIYTDLIMELPKNRVTCLLGESGCGKTSLLRQMAGFNDGASFSEFIVTDNIYSQNRIDLSCQVAYMAQQDLLMPWLNVLENVLLCDDLSRSLFQKKASSRYEKREQALALLAKLGVAEVAYHKPNQLSGGMRQRVALARTLIQDKHIVLMDEPFAALDALNRYKLQDLAAQMLADKTVLLVTHDAQEALRLGEQILLFPMANRNQAREKNLDVEALSNKSDSSFQFIKPNLPNTDIPRAIDAELGLYQAQLLERMGVVSC